MKITRNNYEQYFLDYFEGALDKVMEGMLLSFLEQNPDLKQEFDSFRVVTLEQDSSYVMQGKDLLKKEVINETNADTFYAAYLEGDLSSVQMKETEAFADENPLRSRDFNLMKHTVLKPDMSIEYRGKQALKRHVITPVYRRLWYAASVAAVLLIMAGLFFNLEYSEKDHLADIPEKLIPTSPLPVATPSPAIIAEKPASPVQEVTPSPAATQAERRPSARPEGPVLPQPLLASRLRSKPASELPATITTREESLEQRTEFAYWNYRSPQEQLAYQSTPYDSSPKPSRTSSLASFAISRLQENIPEEIKEVEERITGTRLALREVAGRGLSGIATLLNIEQQRDERGRLVQLAIGDEIEFRRE